METPARPKPSNSKVTWSWALYDWANSAFALTVMAVFFPIALRQFWLAGSEADATLVLGLTNGGASLVMAILGPVLGAWADGKGRRHAYLVRFAGLGISATACLALAAKGQWQLAVACYFIATVGFAGANVFYDALLLQITDKSDRSRVSALGFSLGYIGGSVLFAVHLAMIQKPEWFGVADAQSAMRIAIASVSVWWALFSIPLIRARDHFGRTPSPDSGLGLSRLKHLMPGVRSNPTLGWFLVAYWFYIDGVHTIIRMAVDYGQAIGLAAGDLALAILLTNAVGFPATWLYGKLGEIVGILPALAVGVLAYVAITGLAVTANETRDFFILAGCVGLVQGGVQAMSRALFANLVPGDDAAAWFGVYNIVGKFAAVMGPVLVGIVSATTGEPRWAIGSVAILLLVGLALLWQVSRSSSSDQI